MHKISSALGKIMSGYGATTSLNISIRRSWNDIVGDDLVDLTNLVDVRFVGEGKINVYVKVVCSAILLVRSRKDEIVQAIKILSSIQNVSLILKPTHFAKKMAFIIDAGKDESSEMSRPEDDQ
jgi:hypothetical protein